MSLGTIQQTINAARVKLYRGNVELTLVDDVTYTATRTHDRVNTRAGPVDTFRWIYEEIRFKAQITELLLNQLKTDTQLSTTSGKTYNNWRIDGLSTSGSAGDTTSETHSATLLDFEHSAPENGLSTITGRLLVSGRTT